MDMENRDAELPPIEVTPKEEGNKDTEKSEPIKELGSERNPEFLPQGQTSSTVSDDSSASTSTQPSDDTSESSRVTSSSSSIVGQSPQIADDVDLIEKEWVEKAKEIVEKTKENPYLQNKAISEIKADYIQKRYNKNIAKSEE